MQSALRLPKDLQKHLGTTKSKEPLLKLLRKSSLHTVCEEARCPNIGECFSQKTATFMILGDRCTRRCHFCSVKTQKPLPPDPKEPESLAKAVHELGLEYVVITSVDRDDLPDHGASHFVACMDAVRQKNPSTKIELLTPDFKGKLPLIDLILKAKPNVFGHNIETTQRLYEKVRPQSRFETSLNLLSYVAKSPCTQVKSGFMVGLGETDKEVFELLELLHETGVKRATTGQYLRPSLKHWPVDRYVPQECYTKYKEKAHALGFLSYQAGPFVRSSYHAKEAY